MASECCKKSSTCEIKNEPQEVKEDCTRIQEEAVKQLHTGNKRTVWKHFVDELRKIT